MKIFKYILSKQKDKRTYTSNNQSFKTIFLSLCLEFLKMQDEDNVQQLEMYGPVAEATDF